MLNEHEGIDIGRTTLRRILVNAGLSSPRRRRPPKHRVRRQRMPREGMLIQMDGSHHPWLGDQAPPFTLLIAVDNATGTVFDALFCEQEDAHNYFLGLSSPRRRRPPKHRVRRQRMPREGMLIQMDGSHHPWLGDQAPPFTLLIAVDNATGTVFDALFCEQEDAHNYFLVMQGLIQRCGIPVALYTDRHGVFKHTPGSGLPRMPTQFSRAMDELGIQMIFALSPQGKGRVERAAGTFQDRLVTELRLAEASSILEANGVLKQFLPRFNRRFGVPPLYPEPAFRPLDPELCLEQTLCFKHRRKVARDNTVRFQLHTLQLLPQPERPSYAGAAVEVLESLDGRLSVRHEGRIVPAHEAPPSPVFLRNGSGRSTPVPVPPSGANGLGERWTATLEPLDSRAEEERVQGAITDSADTASKPKAASARKPTFLQKERWKAIQKARRKGMSLRAIERDLGINRATVRKYLDSEGPPTRPPRAGPTTSASDTLATYPSDIYAEHLAGHLS